MKLARVVGVILLVASALVAQTTTPSTKKTTKREGSELQALKDALAAQQSQIEALSKQLQQTNQQLQQTNQQFQQTQQELQQLQQAAAEAQQKASAAQVQARQDQETVSSLQSDVSSLKTAETDTVKKTIMALQQPPETLGIGSPQTFSKQMESDITIHFRGINITPGGYAAGEFVRRSRALSADVATPFNSLTMPGASQSQLSEFYGSGRQSKATVFVEGKVGNVDLSSYISSDFLSAGVTSTSTSTNSYTLRLRQAWAQAKLTNGWSFLAGQSWSLATEDAKGIAPDDDMGKTNDVRPKTVDSTYNVGFVFARQWGFRLTKSFGDKFAAAVAVENPQATITTHGNASNYLLGNSGASNSYNTGGTYSYNPAPDLIAKVAFDPGFGHYEIYGLVSRFTDRVFPCVEYAKTSTLCTATGATTATGAYNTSKEGGGFGASARWKFVNHLTFGLKGAGGSGVGRYAAGGLPDATINADGSIRLIKNLQGLGTLEWKQKKLDLYSYGGVEYAARAYNWDALASKGAGANVGYGAPTFANSGCYTEVAPGSGGFSPTSLSNCAGDTRALMEGTAGFWYRFYSGPRGKFQYGNQFSYVTRNTWSGGGRQPNGLDFMVFSSFRYYLP